METNYYVEIKGINENKNCWRCVGKYSTLKASISYYNSYKGGCEKRIVRKKIIIKKKVVRHKKY